MLALYGHPFSSYTWKALIALYANDIEFEFRMVDADHPENVAFVQSAGPLGKFPVLQDGDIVVVNEEHYKLVGADEVSDADRATYARRSGRELA